MSLKHKYIKLDDNNLELETFSLPSPREGNTTSSEIPEDFHQRFESYFQPYVNSKEEHPQDPIVVGGIINDQNIVSQGTQFRYPNEYYTCDYKSHNIFQRLWHGPENVVDEPPSYKEDTILFKIDQFPRIWFQYRLNRSVRYVILAMFTFIQILLITIFFVWPYANISDDSILPLECNSRVGYPSGVLNNKCGVNYEKCGFQYDKKENVLINPAFKDKRDLEDGITIRCPALCDQGGLIYAPLSVGNQRIRYRNYIIGDHVYRGDTYPCSAAYHHYEKPHHEESTLKRNHPYAYAKSVVKRSLQKVVKYSLISKFTGGCIKMKNAGAQLDFPTFEGSENIKFDSFFPDSFVLEKTKLQSSFKNGCLDPRFFVLAINLVAFGIVFYLYESSVAFWWLVVEGYWFQSMIMDPALLVDPRDWSTFNELISLTMQKFLPLCFILYVLYDKCIKRTLNDEYESGIWKIFMLITFWIGLLNNITFDRLPVDRLTISDLKEQKGGIAATVFILSIIIVSAVTQAINVWKANLFKRYFKLYVGFIAALSLLGALPGFGLRIHHYILGLLLIPGCSTRGRTAYILQGVLLGLLVNGIARWDFASIIETQRALLRGSAGDLAKPPIFDIPTSPKIKDMNMFDEISWKLDSADTSISNFDGVSLLINDMEVYVGTNTTISISSLKNENQLFADLIYGALLYENNVKLYLRIARCDPLDSSKRGDYTNAGTLIYPYGNWTMPLPGVS
ncbi:uncharacterized protein HGUI_02093 [Hanseniaspora guilliermondii]|uniref:LCCL domain-containing protein n=1 Tax=Hanseniaspora guilliermondii TaxID=56406 RepID=A0A1L0CM03_9ASCO|nr:uncharacterized protein HGUI_02093 [Hanseniaspora guilliermondii]